MIWGIERMTIVCYGDSNTWGYDPRDIFGAPYDRAWPDILAELSGFSVNNEGSNGRQIPEKPYIPPGDPDLLTVMLGSNDLLQGASPDEICIKMERFLNLLPIGPDKILLIAPPPMKLGAWVESPELVQDSVHLARSYRWLSEAMGVCFADAGDWKIPLAFDGVHFTQEGHRLFAHGLYHLLIQTMR